MCSCRAPESADAEVEPDDDETKSRRVTDGVGAA